MKVPSENEVLEMTKAASEKVIYTYHALKKSKRGKSLYDLMDRHLMQETDTYKFVVKMVIMHDFLTSKFIEPVIDSEFSKSVLNMQFVSFLYENLRVMIETLKADQYRNFEADLESEFLEKEFDSGRDFVDFVFDRISRMNVELSEKFYKEHVA